MNAQHQDKTQVQSPVVVGLYRLGRLNKPFFTEPRQTSPGWRPHSCGWTGCLGHPHISPVFSHLDPMLCSNLYLPSTGRVGMLPWLLLPRRPCPRHCPSPGHQCRTSLLLFLTCRDTGSQLCWPCVQLPGNGMHSSDVPAVKLHCHTTTGDSCHGLSENQAGLSGDR